jgi:hypothetical protein
LFAQLSPGLASNHVDSFAPRHLIEPGCKNGSRIEPVGMARQLDEGRLDYFLSQLRRADLSKRRGIDKVQVATDDLGEGIFGVLRGITSEQFQIVFVHFY